MLFKRSRNVDAKTLDGSDAISLASSAGHHGVEVVHTDRCCRVLTNLVLQLMLKERRENMALSNANNFLEEYEAEENFKLEQRAIKTAKVLAFKLLANDCDGWLYCSGEGEASKEEGCEAAKAARVGQEEGRGGRRTDETRTDRNNKAFWQCMH